jgi:hypothetical protein
MSAPNAWDYGLMLPEQPIPKFIRDRHRVRILDWNFLNAADYDTTNDWTQTLTGTGTQTRLLAPTIGLSCAGIRLSVAAAGDGAVAVHKALFIQMPSTGQGTLQYLAWDVSTGSAASHDWVFGFSSGTPVQTFDPATRNVLTAGAGILIRRTASTNLWELMYKTAAGSVLTLGSVTRTVLTSTFYRVGFLVATDPNAGASNNLALGRIIPFLFPLNAGGGQAGGDDLADLPDTAFFLGTNGFTLDRATHSDASVTQCGIAHGTAGIAGVARNLDIRRLVYADNLRR